MSLDLIVGPPNSGRTGAVLDRFEAALERDPLLVVPTRDDVERFEWELCERHPALIGGAVVDFGGLVEAAELAAGLKPPPLLTDSQRLRVAREAAGGARLSALARSARRPGFGPALVRAIDEIQTTGVDPDTLAARADSLGAGPERELARLYDGYARTRDRLRRSDPHTRGWGAVAGLRENPDAFGRRPVLLYGFDDMDQEQVELVDALARATEVTVALPWEDRDAFVARASLRPRLETLGGRVVETRSPDPANTESGALYHLERQFLEPGADRVAPDPGLSCLSAAGIRAEAELIAAEIAGLLDAGEQPDGIAIVLRSPDRQGELYGRVLAAYGIPVTVEASLPLRATAAGRGLVSLLRVALAQGDADEVLTMLRTPGFAGPEDADWLERGLLRGDEQRGDEQRGDEALAAFRGRKLFELSDLRKARRGRPLLEATARFARRIAQYPDLRSGTLPDPATGTELRAGEVAADACLELAELGLPVAPEDLIATLADLPVRLRAGADRGRVRVLSPYRVRGRRVRHLFVASLDAGSFPRPEVPASLLGPERRKRLGLPEQASASDEERYLFYVCLSRPSVCLHLSRSAADEDGRPAEPSPFLDEVGRLLEPAGGEPLAGVRSRRREPRDVTVPPADAASAPELARALAAGCGGDLAAAGDTLQALDVPAAVRTQVEGRLADAVPLASHLPGPLVNPRVLGALSGVELYGATTLEGHWECSYRWFVNHELNPQPLGLPAEPQRAGSLVHAALAELYRHPPTAEARPTPKTLGAWTARARETVLEQAATAGMQPRDAASRAMLRRVEAAIIGFLGVDAEREIPFAPEPALIEARFGEDDQAVRAPLDLGDFSVHGSIDRVDVDRSVSPPRGLITDYKNSKAVTSAVNLLEEGKLQPQLYAIALREQWDIEPVGAIYQPLRPDRGRIRPRGVVRATAADTLHGALGLYQGEPLTDEDFETALTTAREEAAKRVDAMRRGAIDRDPLGGECPRWCDLQPICRLERSRQPDPVEPEDEEDEVA